MGKSFKLDTKFLMPGRQFFDEDEANPEIPIPPKRDRAELQRERGKMLRDSSKQLHRRPKSSETTPDPKKKTARR